MTHSINQKIVQFMENKGFNALSFSNKLKVKSPSTIYNIVKGKNKASTDLLEAIAEAFPEADMNQFLRHQGAATYDFEHHQPQALAEQRAEYESKEREMRATIKSQSETIKLLRESLKDKQRIIDIYEKNQS